MHSFEWILTIRTNKTARTEAQYNLGTLYVIGQGVEQSFEIAHECWMKSAEQGDEDSIGNLHGLDKHEGKTTTTYSFTPPKRAQS